MKSGVEYLAQHPGWKTRKPRKASKPQTNYAHIAGFLGWLKKNADYPMTPEQIASRFAIEFSNFSDFDEDSFWATWSKASGSDLITDHRTAHGYNQHVCDECGELKSRHVR